MTFKYHKAILLTLVAFSILASLDIIQGKEQNLILEWIIVSITILYISIHIFLKSN